jgi:hypothetical protein
MSRYTVQNPILRLSEERLMEVVTPTGDLRVGSGASLMRRPMRWRHAGVVTFHEPETKEIR